MGFTVLSRKFEKFINIHWNTKSLRRSSMTLHKVFCKDYANISYQNASFLILEHSAAYLFTNFNCMLVLKKCLFLIDGDTLSHHGKVTALHKLILIVYNWWIKSSQNFLHHLVPGDEVGKLKYFSAEQFEQRMVIKIFSIFLACPELNRTLLLQKKIKK